MYDFYPFLYIYFFSYIEKDRFRLKPSSFKKSLHFLMVFIMDSNKIKYRFQMVIYRLGNFNTIFLIL